MPTSSVSKLPERKIKILNILRQKQSIAPGDLAQIIQVSESTLRRDLNELVETGLVQRRFGKAELTLSSDNELPFLLRTTINEDEKRRIAQTALNLLQNGETVFISGGTTTLELARLLPEQRRLTVITNALTVANLLVDKPGINLVILGGQVRADEQTMHGHLTVWGVQQLRADKLFYGAEAISLEHGLTHSQLIEVNTDRALADAATKMILLADHTKFDKVAPACIVPLSQVDVIITGHETSADYIEKLQAQNIQIIQV